MFLVFLRFVLIDSLSEINVRSLPHIAAEATLKNCVSIRVLAWFFFLSAVCINHNS